MSAKHKVFKHLNSMYQLNIRLDAKIKVVKDINDLAVGAFRWIVTEGEYEHALGSQYSLKTLASLIDSGDKLIIVKTNNNYLRVTNCFLKPN